MSEASSWAAPAHPWSPPHASLASNRGRGSRGGGRAGARLTVARAAAVTLMVTQGETLTGPPPCPRPPARCPQAFADYQSGRLQNKEDNPWQDEL